MKIPLKSALKNLSNRLSRLVARPADVIKRSRFALFCFYLLSIFPGLLVLILFVVFPTFAKRTDFSQAHVSHPQNSDVAAIDPETRGQKQELFKTIDSLKIEKSYLNTMHEMAKSDTFALSLNLRDSLFCLYIKGVPVRQCKVQAFRHSRAFEYIRRNGLLDQYNAVPFELQRDFATIRKIPIKEIEAPKDTTEAYERMNEQIHLERPDVYCRLFFSNDLVIDVSQTNSPSFLGFLKRMLFHVRWKIYVFKEDVKALLNLQIPEHPMWMKLNLTDDDAKAIYRSLQDHIRLALLM